MRLVVSARRDVTQYATQNINFERMRHRSSRIKVPHRNEFEIYSPQAERHTDTHNHETRHG